MLEEEWGSKDKLPTAIHKYSLRRGRTLGILGYRLVLCFRLSGIACSTGRCPLRRGLHISPAGCVHSGFIADDSRYRDVLFRVFVSCCVLTRFGPLLYRSSQDSVMLQPISNRTL